jgi:hypothetical protein
MRRWVAEINHESGKYEPRYIAVEAKTEREAHDKASDEIRRGSGWEIDDIWREDEGPSLNDVLKA